MCRKMLEIEAKIVSFCLKFCSLVLAIEGILPAEHTGQYNVYEQVTLEKEQFCAPKKTKLISQYHILEYSVNLLQR